MITNNERAEALSHVERVCLAGLTRWDDPEFDAKVGKVASGLVGQLPKLLNAGEVEPWQLLGLDTVADVNQFLADVLFEAGDYTQAERDQLTLVSQRLRLMELVWPLVGLQSAGEIDLTIRDAVQAGRIAIDDLREPQTAEDVVGLLQRITAAWREG